MKTLNLRYERYPDDIFHLFRIIILLILLNLLASQTWDISVSEVLREPHQKLFEQSIGVSTQFYCLHKFLGNKAVYFN